MKAPQNITSKIPVFNIPDTPIVSTTQDHLPIAEVVNNMYLFKDGGCALVIESTSLNFGLLSEREQEAVVAAYAALINSLSFAVQILVRTQRKDISSYIAYLDKSMPTITNPKLKVLMEGYREFISETIKKKNVLGKRFYIIIPFSPFELGISSSAFKDIFTKNKGPLNYSKEYVLKKAGIVLIPKKDHLIRQASRLGLRLRQLTNEELVELAYDIYNPPKETIQPKEGEEIDGQQ